MLPSYTLFRIVSKYGLSFRRELNVSNSVSTFQCWAHFHVRVLFAVCTGQWRNFANETVFVNVLLLRLILFKDIYSIYKVTVFMFVHECCTVVVTVCAHPSRSTVTARWRSSSAPMASASTQHRHATGKMIVEMLPMKLDAVRPLSYLYLPLSLTLSYFLCLALFLSFNLPLTHTYSLWSLSNISAPLLKSNWIVFHFQRSMARPRPATLSTTMAAASICALVRFPISYQWFFIAPTRYVKIP